MDCMSSNHWTHGLIAGTLDHMNPTAQNGPPMEHRNPSSPLWVAARDELRTRRAARASRKALERELASYTTPAEQNELDAILERYPADEVAEIRQIINRRRAA